MKYLISEDFAAKAILSILSLVVIFHFLVVFNIIPFDIVWGGRINDRSQLLVFEAISITLNLIMLSIVAIKAGLMNLRIHTTVIKVGLWMMFGLFLLNTIGNLFSNNELEKMIFTPMTALLALFSCRLAIGSTTRPEVN